LKYFCKQKCNNIRYKKYFTTLINSWRKDWQQGDFSFYWVQLSAWQQANDIPHDNCDWASVNDQQRRTLKVPNTGMAVSYDIGEAEDIHPHNKMDVGKRLALLALKNDYHFDNIVCSGPLYKSHKIENGKVEIIFDNVGSGLMVGKKVLTQKTVEDTVSLQRFQIVGKDGKWLWANAEIIGKNKIVVSHHDVLNPTEVRYAWSRNPEGANLYNKEGLPASVFTTKEQ
jgi:sialate O-acetylesterase